MIGQTMDNPEGMGGGDWQDVLLLVFLNPIGRMFPWELEKGLFISELNTGRVKPVLQHAISFFQCKHKVFLVWA